jgi:hypothetical protein
LGIEDWPAGKQERLTWCMAILIKTPGTPVIVVFE